MLSTIYPIGFVVSLLGLIMWFYFEENRKMSRMMSLAFLGGFMVYLFSLAFSDGATSYKLLILFRDLMVLAGVTTIFSFFKKRKIIFFTLLAVVFAVLQYKYLNVLQQTFPQRTTTFNITLDKEGELLVEIKDAHQISELQSIADQYDLTFRKAFNPLLADQTDLDDYILVNIPEKSMHQFSEIEGTLQASNLIDWVEDNEILTIDPMEITPLRRARKGAKNFGLNDPGVIELWGFAEMNVGELYKVLNKVKPKKKASIFILDTGIDAQHEDIKGNYKSIKKSYDKDTRGHGTHCAGIAAAVSNNKKGVASFSKNNDFVEVTSITVLGSFGGGSQAGIIKGMIEAADNGADVISMSLGGRSNDSRQRAYQKAVDYANKAGAIVVVAAGNSNANAKLFAPACAPGVISVSAIDTSLNRASFSNYITDLNMGIAAPGVSIYSTIPDNKYAEFNGTSMATPYVAGLLGLMKSIRPSLTTKEAYTLLKDTGKETGNVKETGAFIQPAACIKKLID